MSRVLSLAGFQVTLIGRFWVIPEGSRSSVHAMQADGRRKTPLLEHKGLGPLRGVFLG